MGLKPVEFGDWLDPDLFTGKLSDPRREFDQARWDAGGPHLDWSGQPERTGFFEWLLNGYRH